MTNKIIDNYFEYLEEQASLMAKLAKFAATKGSAIKKAAPGYLKDQAKTAAKWTVGLTALGISWKAANLALRDTVKKCQGLKSQTGPGYKVCVAKEQNKIYNQKIAIARKYLSNCANVKDPELCKQKWGMELQKAQNNIKVNNMKIQELIGEQAAFAAKVGKGAVALAGSIAIMTMFDKVLFMINRSTQALFRKAVRQCGTYKDNTERKLCMSKLKVAALTKKLNDLNNLLAKCSQTKKKQEECKEKIQKHIDKTKITLQIQKDNITGYSKELEIEKREEEYKNAM